MLQTLEPRNWTSKAVPNTAGPVSIIRSFTKAELINNVSGGGVTLSGGEPLMHHSFCFICSADSEKPE